MVFFSVPVFSLGDPWLNGACAHKHRISIAYSYAQSTQNIYH